MPGYTALTLKENGIKQTWARAGKGVSVDSIYSIKYEVPHKLPESIEN
jgi:hypothetical protein